jgi:phosphogluconate 2-dehydrogenase
MSAERRPVAVLYDALADAPRMRLAERFELVEFRDGGGADRTQFVAALADADALIGLGIRLTDAELAAAHRLRAIALVAVGVDGFDLDQLSRRGIALMNTPDVLTETVSDLALALILAVNRRVVELANYVRAGHWTRRIQPDHYGRDVHGATLGIVGMGRIGHAIARRARLGFGMTVRYTSTETKPQAEREFGAQRRSLDELLAESAVVCLTVPLNAGTQALIGERELSLMAPSAILINVSRGAVVDEPALIAALAAHRIAGAGLDVYAQEPLPANSPLLSFENVVALPHVASATVQAREAMAWCAVDNLCGYFDGEPLNVVNPDALVRGSGEPTAAGR